MSFFEELKVKYKKIINFIQREIKKGGGGKEGKEKHSEMQKERKIEK